MGMRAVPPPPLAVRRVLHVLWPAVGVLVTALATPVLVAGAFAALVDRRARLFRITAVVVLLMWVDIGMLIGCWRLWLACPTKDGPTWLEDHERLLVSSLDRAMVVGRRWVGFEVRLADRMHLGSVDTPLVAFARHAGPADSIALAWLLSRTAGRLPRIVLADALRWDPAVDTILTRLHSYFVPSEDGSGNDRLRGVAALASSLRAQDVLLLFPEGQNWSPRRRRKLIEILHERGDSLRAARASRLRHVLPVRTRGPVACLTARPDADVMVVAHAGFERLTSLRQIYEAVPFTRRPFLVKAWTYAADELPDDESGIAAWIEQQWDEVDTWVGEHSPDPATRGEGTGPGASGVERA
jgi:1-acyl-sn-glycerol-3-phosphate acyltransferase